MAKTNDPKSPIEVYKDRAGDWRWRAVAKNGNVLADSGEGYRNYGDMRKALPSTFHILAFESIPVPPPADAIEVLQRKPEGIHPGMAAGADRIFPVLLHPFPQRRW